MHNYRLGYMQLVNGEHQIRLFGFIDIIGICDGIVREVFKSADEWPGN